MAGVEVAVRRVTLVMILSVLAAAELGLVAWSPPRTACALAATRAVAAQAGTEVVSLDAVPPVGGPVHLDEAALPGVERFVADRLVAASKAYGAEHLDVFAGLLLAGGQVWLGFTVDAARHLTAVQARVERPDLLRTFIADFPEGALRSLQHRISADLTSLADEGVDVAMIGVDVRRNRVEVGVRSVGGAAADTLGRRYGTAMLLVQENVVVRTLEAAARDQPGPAPRTGPSDAAPPLDPDRCSP